MKIQKMMIAVFAATTILASCSGDDEFDTPVPVVKKGDYDSGVLVLNEGQFNHGNASLSYLGYSGYSVFNNIFSTANNGQLLGDTAQDIVLNGDKAYIVVNVSGTVEIANRYTMKAIATISGLVNPRYIAIDGNKAYVTAWGDGSVPTDDYIAVINLDTNAITGTISVPEGPEQIVAYNGKLFVSQSGGFSTGHTVSIIDPVTSSQVYINVGDVPTDLRAEGNILWVGCQGVSYGTETAGGIYKINMITNALISSKVYPEATKHVRELNVVNGDAYYLLDHDVYQFSKDSTNLPAYQYRLFTTGAVTPYSMKVLNDRIWIGDAKDYSSAGQVLIYSAGSSDGAAGSLLETYTVGISPSEFVFNLD